MMKHEFEEHLGREVPSDEYKLIEKVYMYHPLMHCDHPKQKIADLYDCGGMGLISEMLPTAEIFRKAEEDLLRARRAYEQVQTQYETLKVDYAAGRL